MVGSAARAAAVCWVFCATACGGKDSAGTSSSPPTEAVWSSARTLCAQLAKCYPDLQTAGTCPAPSSVGPIEYPSWESDPQYKQLVEKCASEVPDQAGLSPYLACLAAADQGTAACFSSCPADGLPCTTAGSDAVRSCEVSDAPKQLQDCIRTEQP